MIFQLNAIPLAVQITGLAGYVLSKTFLGGRSERNEFLLLHAFNEKEFIVPDKYSFKEESQDATVATAGRKKPQYAGGLVLDPKVGLYRTFIVLMDFNSLYPSIIQEFNICFTTLSDDKNTEFKLSQGILPEEISKLVERRREVKKLMKNSEITPEERQRFDIQQLALKLTANSMYGCLGFSKSRFYAQPLAARITELGRKILVETKEVVEKMGYDVIYGDTDSLMINTNEEAEYSKALSIGTQIKKAVNNYYKQIELDIDGIFRSLLLLKKKKYAAITVTYSGSKATYTQEIKGLDIVRRDWSQIASKAGQYIIENILSNQAEEVLLSNIITYLKTLHKNLKENRIDEKDLVITKQLTKDPAAYTEKKSLPHVQVAARYNLRAGVKRLRQGDTVNYVICDDGTDKAATQRAYHVEEYKTKNLKIDIKYYLTQQLYPLISRLIEPIEFVNGEQIAVALGIEGLKFRSAIIKKELDVKHTDNIFSVVNKFVGSDPFKFKCIKCFKLNIINESTDLNKAFNHCQNSECAMRPLDYLPSISNQLLINCRKIIQKYYQCKLICEDPACDRVVKKMPLMFGPYQFPICSCGKGVLYREYSEKDLYKQQAYFVHLFDLSSPRVHEQIVEAPIKAACEELAVIPRNFLKKNKYFHVNLGELFSKLTSNDAQLVFTNTQEETFVDDQEDL